MICLDSTLHPECPLVEGYVRGELHAAYIVAPPRVKASSGYGGNVAKVSTLMCYWSIALPIRQYNIEQKSYFSAEADKTNLQHIFVRMWRTRTGRSAC